MLVKISKGIMMEREATPKSTRTQFIYQTKLTSQVNASLNDSNQRIAEFVRELSFGSSSPSSSPAHPSPLSIFSFPSFPFSLSPLDSISSHEVIINRSTTIFERRLTIIVVKSSLFGFVCPLSLSLFFFGVTPIWETLSKKMGIVKFR